MRVHVLSAVYDATPVWYWHGARVLRQTGTNTALGCFKTLYCARRMVLRNAGTDAGLWCYQMGQLETQTQTTLNHSADNVRRAQQKVRFHSPPSCCPTSSTLPTQAGVTTTCVGRVSDGSGVITTCAVLVDARGGVRDEGGASELTCHGPGGAAESDREGHAPREHAGAAT
eukprot:1570366-Rhodomonas_salina.2